MIRTVVNLISASLATLLVMQVASAQPADVPTLLQTPVLGVPMAGSPHPGAQRTCTDGEEKPRPPSTLRLYEAPDEQKRARGMLSRFVAKGVARAAKAREQEIACLKTPEQWRARQKRTRARLSEFLGDFGPKSPLNPQIVGKLDRDDYVIEKLIFESQPGYYCTANVYVPKRREFPQPGVLFTCGHSPYGKASVFYHEACLGLVLKGYVVLALDPTGQGERSEYFDLETGKHLVPLTVSQHHYLARPSWLVGRSLAGYRTWDCVRAVDYLVSRSEVDPEKIAAVGNSGGGQMALLITAVDPRVKVCAAAHPGGSMENTYLTGRNVIDREILSLIPPRPCLFIVGKDSGEAPGHQRRLNDMLRFYEGLGVDKDRGKLAIVDGVHNMGKPKREASYAWLNKWFAREGETGREPPLQPETIENLHCTKSGYVLKDVGGETGQTLNAKLAQKLRPPRTIPDDAKSADALRIGLKKTIQERIGLKIPQKRIAPESIQRGSFEGDDFVTEKLVLQSEEGISLPSLLFVPKKTKRGTLVVVHAAELGKPTSTTSESLPLELVCKGHVVFSIDVRGAGETDPRIRSTLPPLASYNPQQFNFERCAVNASHLETTMRAMRAYDVIRAMDYVSNRGDLSGRSIVLVGEGLGGAWMLTAAAMDTRPAGVVCVKTIPSYKLIVGSQYYKSRDYFWVNGALKDFDLPDLIGLVAPRVTVLLDPVDAMLNPLEPKRCGAICKWPFGMYKIMESPQGLRVVHTANGTISETAKEVIRALEEFKFLKDATGLPKK